MAITARLTQQSQGKAPPRPLLPLHIRRGEWGYDYIFLEGMCLLENILCIFEMQRLTYRCERDRY